MENFELMDTFLDRTRGGGGIVFQNVYISESLYILIIRGINYTYFKNCIYWFFSVQNTYFHSSKCKNGIWYYFYYYAISNQRFNNCSIYIDKLL